MNCLNVSRFDLAFRVFAATNDVQTGSYGEFNILLNYAWYFERDEVCALPPLFRSPLPSSALLCPHLATPGMY